MLLGAERAHLAVRELAARGTAAAIVLASGYTETGEEGARRQQQLMEAAGAMRILGPNTIGLVNLTDNIVLSASGALEMDHFPVGAIGVVSQSGGILGALLSRAAARGIGLSKLISTSNEVDLELADFIDHLRRTMPTRVIALYIEAIRNPERFRAAVRKARAAGKPVVAFKIGRSEAGAKAAVSHTGALAGADRMYDALFRQVGVIRAQTFDDLLDIPAALATGRKLRGKRVAILTSTGGAGTLVSDSLGVAGFETPAPDAETAAGLRALQTGDHAVLDRNPIDVTLAGLQPDLLRGAIRVLLAQPELRRAGHHRRLVGRRMPELMADAIHDCLPMSDKPVIAYVSPHAPEVGAVLTAARRAGLYGGRKLHGALAGMLLAAEAPAGRCCRADETAGRHQRTSRRARWTKRRPRSCSPASAFPRCASGSSRRRRRRKRAARELGGRVVLKILSAEITHKSDVGGVAVNLTPETIGGAADRDGGRGRSGDRRAAATLPGAGDGRRRHRADPGHAPRPAGHGDPARHGRRHRRAVQGHDACACCRRKAASAATTRSRWCRTSRPGRCWTAFADGRRPTSRRWCDDRRLLADGGAARRSPGRGRDQPGLRPAGRAGRARRGRRRGAGSGHWLSRLRPVRHWH